LSEKIAMFNLLTIDLEEWYHPEAIRRSGLTINAPASQVIAATLPLLDWLKRAEVKATFFTVGEVAEAHPRLIERLLDEGHELAFHGWTHKPLWVLNPDTFAQEIEQFLHWRYAHFRGVEVLGYRAPTFSLDASTAWAIEILQRYGFRYDSSIFPARNNLYGVDGAPRQPYRLRPDDLTAPAAEGLLEIPMSVAALGPLKIGFTGGLYLRALPYALVKYFFQQNNAQGHPAMVYIHPWETHAATPRLPLSIGGRLVLYYGLPSLAKVERLLADFSFTNLQAYLAAGV